MSSWGCYNNSQKLCRISRKSKRDPEMLSYLKSNPQHAQRDRIWGTGCYPMNVCWERDSRQLGVLSLDVDFFKASPTPTPKRYMNFTDRSCRRGHEAQRGWTRRLGALLSPGGSSSPVWVTLSGTGRPPVPQLQDSLAFPCRWWSHTWDA